MPLASETITLAGSGIVFNNTYGAAVTEAYRGAIITAEHTFQGLFTGSVTLNVDFELQPLSAGFVSQSSFPTVTGCRVCWRRPSSFSASCEGVRSSSVPDVRVLPVTISSFCSSS